MEDMLSSYDINLWKSPYANVGVTSKATRVTLMLQPAT